MWVVLGRDGQLMSEQETLLYFEVMMMMKSHVGLEAMVARLAISEDGYTHFAPMAPKNGTTQPETKLSVSC
jgi:hypothetical protein